MASENKESIDIIQKEIAEYREKVGLFFKKTLEDKELAERCYQEELSDYRGKYYSELNIPHQDTLPMEHIENLETLAGFIISENIDKEDNLAKQLDVLKFFILKKAKENKLQAYENMLKNM